MRLSIIGLLPFVILLVGQLQRSGVGRLRFLGGSHGGERGEDGSGNDGRWHERIRLY
jgi:hypothetical protein